MSRKKELAFHYCPLCRKLNTKRWDSDGDIVIYRIDCLNCGYKTDWFTNTADPIAAHLKNWEKGKKDVDMP